MKSDERSISVLRLGGFLFCQFFFLAVIIYGGNLDAIYSHIQIQVFLPVKKNTWQFRLTIDPKSLKMKSVN